MMTRRFPAQWTAQEIPGGLAIADRLAKADSSNTEWQRDLAFSHANVGLMLARQGERAEALDHFNHGRGR